MQFPKYITYLLIALLILALACLVFLWLNHRETKDQSTLLVAMAEKLGAVKEKRQVAAKNESANNESGSTNNSISEEEQDQIVAIADKLCFDKELTDEENALYKRFSVEIDKEKENSEKVLNTIVDKFLNKGELNAYEKEFYDFYPEDIDSIVRDAMLFNSIIKKLTEGNNDFTEEELQFRENNAKEIEKELLSLKEADENKKGANPPLVQGERIKIILSFFEDGVPKTVTELAEMYSDRTGTKVNKGNISTIFGKLVDQHKLIAIKPQADGKVYHGLVEWFDGKKLKPQYAEKIPKL